MVTDVIIIGGGAAGLCSAIYLKQQNPALSVRIMEALPRVGKKLALTGNGRCNITNKNIDISRYHGNNVEFARYALEKHDRLFCETFFEKIGVPFIFEGEKAFPSSLQAASVVDCLRFEAERLGVITHLETKITNIQISGGNYKVISENLNFFAKNLIIATGLLSGGEKLGCDGSMLAILKKAGYKIIETTPAIVQVKTVTDIVKQLKGIKINALVTLKADGKTLRSEFGEVLFCDYGLSGPPILQISRQISRTDSETKISLDLFPETSFSELCNMLINRSKSLSYRALDEFFTGMIHKRLGQVILKTADCKLTDLSDTLNENKCKKIASVLKNFTFTVTGTTGFANSQVTAGGLDTTQFNPNTMESLLNKRLYCIGEILDIDGDCGGFNLQWAWSSAICAAESIIGQSEKL